MMKRGSLNQNENAIIVSVPGEERTFPTREALARFVAEADDNRRGIYSNFEYVAKRTLASLNGGGTPPPSDPPAPKPPTRFDDRIAELDQEEEGAETVYSESNEAWLSRLQELRAEVPRPLCPPAGVESGPKIVGGLNPLSTAPLHAPDLVLVEQSLVPCGAAGSRASSTPMADTRQEFEAAVFDLAARVTTVRAALSAAITDDVDKADRLDVLEGCYRVLGDAMDSMWTAWERFD